MIGYLLSENFLEVIFLLFDQGDRRDVVENMLFFYLFRRKTTGICVYFLNSDSFFRPT